MEINVNGLQTQKSILRNVIYGSLTWILPVLLSLITTPVVVRLLGVEGYGVYALILGLIGYSFNFGISRAATKFIAEYRISENSKKIQGTISATLLLSFINGIIGLAALCLAARPLVVDILAISPEFQETAVIGIYIASVIVFVTIVNQAFAAILQGIHRFDVYSKLFNTYSIVLLAGNLLLALNGFEIIALLIWNAAALSTSTISFAVVAKRLLPEFRINFRVNRDDLRAIWSYAAWMVAYSIISNFLLLFERSWITRQFGSESLAYYTVTMSIGLYILGFANSLLLTVSPLTSETQNDKTKLLSLYRRATKLISFIVAFLGCTTAVSSTHFLVLWMGQDFASRSASLLVFHSITFSMLSIGSVVWFMREGLGVPNHNVYIFLVCFVLTILVMVILSPYLGNMAAAIARFIGFGVLFLSIIQFERWLFGAFQKEFWATLLVKLFIALTATSFLEFFVLENLAISWFSLAFSVFCGGIVYCAILWYLRLISPDEKLIIGRMTGFFR